MFQSVRHIVPVSAFGNGDVPGELSEVMLFGDMIIHETGEDAGERYPALGSYHMDPSAVLRSKLLQQPACLSVIFRGGEVLHHTIECPAGNELRIEGVLLASIIPVTLWGMAWNIVPLQDT